MGTLPLTWSQQSRDYLLDHGLDVECHNFHMGHTINAESLAVVRKWLEKQLANE